MKITCFGSVVKTKAAIQGWINHNGQDDDTCSNKSKLCTDLFELVCTGYLPDMTVDIGTNDHFSATKFDHEGAIYVVCLGRE